MGATHKGTCQACGNTQKLPNGRLSNHGYTKEFGFFNGTCMGAKQLPFEQSCDLIKDFIESAKNRIEELNSQIETLKNSKSTSVEIRTFIDRKLGYMWIPATVDFENKVVKFVCNNKEKIKLICEIAWSQDISSEDKAIAAINNVKIGSIVSQIKKIEQYIGWQENRVKNWQAKSLETV
jgi:hypothetical protein